jgi:hypothetical protein
MWGPPRLEVKAVSRFWGAVGADLPGSWNSTSSRLKCSLTGLDPVRRVFIVEILRRPQDSTKSPARGRADREYRYELKLRNSVSRDSCGRSVHFWTFAARLLPTVSPGSLVGLSGQLGPVRRELQPSRAVELGERSPGLPATLFCRGAALFRIELFHGDAAPLLSFDRVLAQRLLAVVVPTARSYPQDHLSRWRRSWSRDRCQRRRGSRIRNGHRRQCWNGRFRWHEWRGTERHGYARCEVAQEAA